MPGAQPEEYGIWWSLQAGSVPNRSYCPMIGAVLYNRKALLVFSSTRIHCACEGIRLGFFAIEEPTGFASKSRDRSVGFP